MKIKLIIITIMILAISLMLMSCGNETAPETEPAVEMTAEEQELPLMTVEEVAENDGKDGRNAYVIVNGIVYDVTNSSRWRGGTHNSYQAGRDLTKEINEVSPHGITVLGNVPAVGRIEE